MKKKQKYKIIDYGDDIRMRVDYHPAVAKRMLNDLKRFKKKIEDVNPSFINQKKWEFGSQMRVEICMVGRNGNLLKKPCFILKNT